MVLARRETSQPTWKNPQTMKKKDLRANCSVVGAVESDMVQGGSVLHVGKHITITGDEITSRVCADHGKSP